jgi:hypothetical protein
MFPHVTPALALRKVPLVTAAGSWGWRGVGGHKVRDAEDRICACQGRADGLMARPAVGLLDQKVTQERCEAVGEAGWCRGGEPKALLVLERRPPQVAYR